MSQLFTTPGGLIVTAGIVGFTVIFLSLFAFASTALKRPARKPPPANRGKPFAGGGTR